MAFISSQSVELTPGRLTRDVASLANVHPLTGALSMLGLMLWAVGIGAALSTWLATAGRLTRGRSVFLLSTAALTTLLLLDDAFQFHESLAVRYLGIPEPFVTAAYPLLPLGYLALNRRVLLETEAILGIAGFALLAVSMGIDVISNVESEWGYFVEDAFKFGGILFWTAYLVRLTRTATQVWSGQSERISHRGTDGARSRRSATGAGRAERPSWAAAAERDGEREGDRVASLPVSDERRRAPVEHGMVERVVRQATPTELGERNSARRPPDRRAL